MSERNLGDGRFGVPGLLGVRQWNVERGAVTGTDLAQLRPGYYDIRTGKCQSCRAQYII